MKNHAIITILCTCAASAAAQTDIDTDHRYAWSENVGWLNWRDANGMADGVKLCPAHLSGWAWSENVGWIHLGDGAPADGAQYANADDTDFGVNIDAGTGDLYGYGWGENIGWVNFDTRSALTTFDQQARYDFGMLRFAGYAWGENIGWVNLDDSEHYVGVCRADFNDDGEVNSLDVLGFLNAFSAGDPAGDFNCDGATNSLDVLGFLNAYAAGCA